MIDVSLILFILFDYLIRIPWNPIKSNHVHNGCITCSRNSKHDNRRRQLRTVLSEFQKKIPQSNSRILESYNPRDPPEGSQRTAIEFNPRIPLGSHGILGTVLGGQIRLFGMTIFNNYNIFILFVHNT